MGVFSYPEPSPTTPTAVADDEKPERWPWLWGVVGLLIGIASVAGVAVAVSIGGAGSGETGSVEHGSVEPGSVELGSEPLEGDAGEPGSDSSLENSTEPGRGSSLEDSTTELVPDTTPRSAPDFRVAEAPLQESTELPRFEPSAPSDMPGDFEPGDFEPGDLEEELRAACDDPELRAAIQTTQSHNPAAVEQFLQLCQSNN